jgi:hypothetical protein
MPKLGKRERQREASEPMPDVDTFLFGNGLTVSDYFISKEGLIGFTDANGREFDLLIDHSRLAEAAHQRLKTLGVACTSPSGS